MDETNKDAALDAIHEEAIKLLSFDLPEEAEDIANLIESLSRYKHDVRTHEEKQRHALAEE